MAGTYTKEPLMAAGWTKILLFVSISAVALLLFAISLTATKQVKTVGDDSMFVGLSSHHERGYCSDEMKKAREANPEDIWKPSIFTKIINREIKVDIIYEDDKSLAFKDIAPKAPVHFLVIPKCQIPRLQDAGDGDQELLGHLMLVVRKVAKEQGLNEDGYRVVINNGRNALQSVFHLHIHVFGGREMDWPPG